VTRRPDLVDEKDVLRAVRLLESLRDDPLPAGLDVEALVSRRVRLLPVPRAFVPIVSLPQFGWASAAAVLALFVGGLGLLAMLGTGVWAAPAALRLALTRGGAALLGAASGLAQSMLHIVTGAAEGLVGDSLRIDTLLTLAMRGSLVVLAVMLFMTFLVVLHETRARRIAG